MRNALLSIAIFAMLIPMTVVTFLQGCCEIAFKIMQEMTNELIKCKALLLFLIMPILASGQIYVDSYRFGGAQLLLDAYPGAAAAYSLRLLDKDYAGDCITVRRKSDGALDTFGFVNNYLDTTALKTFCGTGASDTCWVQIWFDQSGNGINASQITNLNQPIILASGSIRRENSNACLRFDGTSTFMSTSYQPSLGTASSVGYYVSAVSKAITSHTGRIWSSQQPASPIVVMHMRYEGAQYRSFTRDSDNIAMSALGGTTNTNQIHFAAQINNGSANIYVNGSSVVSASASFTGNLNLTSPFEIGRLTQPAPADYLNANLQELVFYATNQSSNRSGIETNVNTFYSIY
jgi:hypothetical protein